MTQVGATALQSNLVFLRQLSYIYYIQQFKRDKKRNSLQFKYLEEQKQGNPNPTHINFFYCCNSWHELWFPALNKTAAKHFFSRINKFNSAERVYFTQKCLFCTKVFFWHQTVYFALKSLFCSKEFILQ